jgi:hypothetical protein
MTTGEELAGRFEEANAEIVSFAESCTHDQWCTLVPGEEWPVGVLMHHVAQGHELVAGWVRTVVDGGDVTATADGVDESNARHARDCANVGVAETAAFFRSLDDGQLGRSGAFGPAQGASFTAEELAGAAERHVHSHLASARAALGRS